MSLTIVVNFNNLEKVGGELAERAEQVIHKAAHDIEARAKTQAPVRTGNLRNSIQTVTHKLGATITAHAFYAIYVEMGTYKMAARPFLRPAVEAVKPGLIAAMSKLLG